VEAFPKATVSSCGAFGDGKIGAGHAVYREGLRRGEPGIMAIFEERPRGYMERADSFGLNLVTPRRRGSSKSFTSSARSSVDETCRRFSTPIVRVGAKRLAIDSLVGFRDGALAPGFRADFRESLYRMIGSVDRTGSRLLTRSKWRTNLPRCR